MGRFFSWLIVAAVILYLLNPYDIPLFFDDILVAILGAYAIYRRTRVQRSEKRGRDGGPGDRRGESGGEDREKTGAWQSADPYEVLGVPQEITNDEIERAYRDLLKKYHPDRVQHLGAEFQEMAEERAKAINEAYAKILRERKGK